MSIPSSRASVADAEQLALDQPALDLPPLGRRVSRAIGREAGRGLGVEAVDGEAVDELGRLAALGEADRPQAARHELGEQPRPIPERACAELQRLVEHGWVPEGDRPGGAWRRVVLDHGGVDAEQRAGQLAGVGDRGGGQQELRLAP